MAEKVKIGLREVRALQPGETIYDAAVPGLGARRQKDSVQYVLRYRTAEGRQRWYTIGRHGAPWTSDSARDEAKRLLGEIVTGGDPMANKKATREAIKMADLCDQYWADVTGGRLLTKGGKPKKATTLKTDHSRLERHIKPLLGQHPVATLSRQDIETFMHQVADGKTARRVKTGNKRGLSNVRGGRGAATRTMGLLSAILTYAVEKGLRADNPAQKVRKFAENKRERRLSDEEYKALGVALLKAQKDAIWLPAVRAIQFLALTGWRSSEALNLRSREVDAARRTVALGDTKTGRSVRPLSKAAAEMLTPVIQTGAGVLVFPASRGDASMTGFRSFWDRVMALGELPGDITPHTLRHSFASIAADLGYSETTIAALIGHKGQTVTSRYVHSADAVLLAAADTVAEHLMKLMFKKAGDEPNASNNPASD
ncbi:MAG: tyrosine-type recombinase/integrase [Acidocella sp.]|nr:tyrosine-type recombinase/integrase [Acidocella sp.]